MSGFHKLSEVSLCQALGTPDQDTHTTVSMWKDVTQNLRQGDTRGPEKRGHGQGSFRRGTESLRAVEGRAEARWGQLTGHGGTTSPEEQGCPRKALQNPMPLYTQLLEEPGDPGQPAGGSPSPRA